MVNAHGRTITRNTTGEKLERSTDHFEDHLHVTGKRDLLFLETRVWELSPPASVL